MSPRPQFYANATIISSSTSVTIRDLEGRAHEMLRAIAKDLQVNASYAVRCLLESTDRETVEMAIIARNGRPKPKRHHYPKRVMLIDTPPLRVIERAQDRVCRDLHGEIPTGTHCRYPNCDCKV